MKAVQLHITGIVQGVGFRPFVYNLARAQGLNGWVLNASDGVHVVVEGDDAAADGFGDQIATHAPPMSLIEHIFTEEIEPEGFDEFEIRMSTAQAGAMTLVSPDIATCPECVAELRDPADRRYRYPFINCTNCGPRFTIIEDVPYDRPMTTMRDFPMCAECAAEYGDPADRRFHAQPDACFTCGPRVYLNLGEGVTRGVPALKQSSAASPPAELAAEPLASLASFNYEPDWCWAPGREAVPRPHRDRVSEAARSDAIVEAAGRLLRAGAVVAVKGLGGFHLACDATNADAVATLRQRKHRWGKPLAIMVPDIETARAYCHVTEQEAALLTGTERPIVLLNRRGMAAGGPPGLPARSSTASKASEDCLSTGSPGGPPAAATDSELAHGVADGLAEIGVMLPYTPVHHLLLGAVGNAPLVMTSGNLSDEPIATSNAEALERLGAIADAFLLHDRDIYSRYDDSVVRVVDGLVEPVRRARGYAPHPLRLPFESDIDIVAAGPEQKNTFTLIKGGCAFVSQHIGDLENAETLASFEDTLALYRELFRVEPALLAHDMHPEYLSTKWALAQDLPKVAVQHHHAHIVSVTAEHNVTEKVVGVSFDGTGYGPDGRIWGGEVLVCDWQGFERAAHLRYMPIPGGAAAIRRPARMALGVLHEYGLVEHPGARPLLSRLADNEQRTVLTMIEREVNCPLTSSMGRLFDAVASIAGVADDARYEGEAAILLEAAASRDAFGPGYRFVLNETDIPGQPVVIDAGGVVLAALDDVANGTDPAVISARFHEAVTECIVALGKQLTQRAGTHYVALAGGVFMNRLVLGGAVERLRLAGITPLTHETLPMNDGAVSFGQAVVAWANRRQML